MHQDELARQFAQSQQHRYGETYQHDTQQAEDDETAAEAELARQFAASQQQRYSGEQTRWRAAVLTGRSGFLANESIG